MFLAPARTCCVVETSTRNTESLPCTTRTHRIFKAAWTKQKNGPDLLIFSVKPGAILIRLKNLNPIGSPCWRRFFMLSPLVIANCWHRKPWIQVIARTSTAGSPRVCPILYDTVPLPLQTPHFFLPEPPHNLHSRQSLENIPAVILLPLPLQSGQGIDPLPLHSLRMSPYYDFLFEFILPPCFWIFVSRSKASG